MLTKHDFVRRYARGEFGNASPTWDTLEDWLTYQHLPGELYHVRNRIAGAETWYNLLAHQVPMVWKVAVDKYGVPNLYISVMAPSEKTVLQGEVLRTEHYLTLLYTTVAKPMREALALQQASAEGLQALGLLKAHMNVRSWEWLQYLFDAYPDHVIEFSTFSVEWGTVPGFNTVYWEVRRY